MNVEEMIAASRPGSRRQDRETATVDVPLTPCALYRNRSNVELERSLTLS